MSSALAANANLDSGAPLSGDAPGFTLTDQFGQPVSLSAYRGKAVVLAFNDSECTTICPLTTAALVEAKAMLGKAGSQVQLLGVDANPKATSVEDVLSYSQLHGMIYQWRYLTGSVAQLKSVWKAYSVGVTISQSSVDHEPAIFVISPQGKLARLYLTQMAYSAVPQLGQLIAGEVASLLPGHPAVLSRLSYAQAGAITPATGTSLPGAGGGYVSLGPGQPRLYLFFATWAQEVTPLAGQLDALNAYQSATSGSGLPPLTAVDEGGIEPSAVALPGFLAGLGQPLSYPVAIDGGGQVADGYGVQGVPWFVLTSAAGKVVWSWEVTVSGWPSTAGLEQHVRAALGSAASAGPSSTEVPDKNERENTMPAPERARHRLRHIARLAVVPSAAAGVAILLAGCGSAGPAASAAAKPGTAVAANAAASSPASGSGDMSGMPGMDATASPAATGSGASAGGINAVPMQVLGTATWQGMKITADAMTPVPFLIYNGTSMQEVKPAKNVSFHLMVLLNDAQTGVVIPYASVWATVKEGSKTSYDGSLWPMISRYMGPHYGNDVSLPGAGTYTMSLLVSPPVSARHAEYQDVWLKPHTVTFTFRWKPVS